ncbi:MAG: hypothetical protein QOK22_2559 [Gaiellaceae bacterium]|nr:hypothetical protein [Gaiellaceae bacterium]
MTGLAVGAQTTGEEALDALRSRLWIVGWWLAGRLVVFGAAAAVHAFGPHGYLARSTRMHVLGVLGSWDGIWYQRIASDGYLLIPGRQSDPAFFPLYPLLLRLVHEAFALGYQAAGVVVSNVAFLVALVAFEALTRTLFDGELARRATIYLAIFPFGYVFSMVYPESFVLAMIALAALAATRGRWGLASVCAAAAALARPEGLFVALPVLMIAWKQRRELTPLARGCAMGAVVAPVAALASFPLYLGGVLGDPLAWNHAERAWGRRFSPLGFVRTFEHLPHTFATHGWVVRDVCACAAYVVLLVAARRAGTSGAWLLGGAAVIGVPLFSGSFDSIGRFGLLAPPVFWGLAWIGQRGAKLDYAVRAASILLLVGAMATVPYIFP